MPAGSTLTVTLTPGTIWVPADAATDAKLNLTANPTVQVAGTTRNLTDVSGTPPTGSGQVLVWNAGTGYWTPSTVPTPANGTVYLGGDGAWHNIGDVLSASIPLFNYMHFN